MTIGILKNNKFGISNLKDNEGVYKKDWLTLLKKENLMN